MPIPVSDPTDILDSSTGDTLTPSEFNDLSSPEQKDQFEQHLRSQGLLDTAEGSPEAVSTAAPEPSAKTSGPAVDSTKPPSLREFVAIVQPDNPERSVPEIVQKWNEMFGHVDPKTLPTRDAYIETVQKSDPSVPKDEIVSDWEDYYKPLGARERDRTVGDYLTNAVNQFATGAAQVPADMFKWVGKASEELDRLLPDVMKNPAKAEDRLTYKLGESIQQLAEKTFPTDPELRQHFIASVLPNTFGQLAGFFVGGAGLSLGKAPMTASALLGAGVQGSQQYEESKQFHATDDAQRKSFWLGSALGTTEAAPLEFLFRGLPVAIGGRLWRGAMTGAVVGAEELIQELGQQIGSNKVAEMFYDKNRSLFEGAGIAAGAGGVTGSVLGFLTGILSRRTGQHAPPQTEVGDIPATETAGAAGTPPPSAGGMPLPPLRSRPEETVSATPEGVPNVEDILKPDLTLDESIKTAADVVDAGVPTSASLEEFIPTQTALKLAEDEVDAAKAALEEPTSTVIPPAILPAAVTATPLPTPDMSPSVTATIDSVTNLAKAKGVPQDEFSTMIQLETGKTSLEDLSPAELQKLSGQLETVIPSEPVPPVEPPSQPVSPISENMPAPEPSKPEPATTAGSETAITKPEETVYQGRGNTPEEIYGKEAVDAGRAVPIFGKGQYYAMTSKDAAQYGKVTAHPRPKLANPFVLDSDKKWRSLIVDAQVPHLDNMNELFYKESQKIPAATEKLQDYLRRKGYDGIIVKLAEGSDETRRLGAMVGHDQIVVFGKSTPAASKSPTAITPPHLVPPQTERFKALLPETRESFRVALQGAAEGNVDELKEVQGRLENPKSAQYGEFVARTGLTLSTNPYKMQKEIKDYFEGFRHTFAEKTATPVTPPVVEKPVKGSVETLVKTEKKPAAVEAKPVPTVTKPVAAVTKSVPTPTANIAAIPKGTMIELRGIRAATGEEITMPEDAAVALSELDASLTRYRQLLECVSA